MITKLEMVSEDLVITDMQNNFLRGCFLHDDYEVPVCILQNNPEDKCNPDYLFVANKCVNWVVDNEQKVFKYFIDSFIEECLEDMLGELSLSHVVIFYEEKYFAIWLSSQVGFSCHSLYTLVDMNTFEFIEDAALYD